MKTKDFKSSKYLPISKVAEYLGVSHTYVINKYPEWLVDARKKRMSFRIYEFNGRKFFNREDIDNLIATCLIGGAI